MTCFEWLTSPFDWKGTPSAESGFGKSERGLPPDEAITQPSTEAQRGRLLRPSVALAGRGAGSAHCVEQPSRGGRVLLGTAGCLGLVPASIVLARVSARRVGFAEPAVLDREN